MSTRGCLKVSQSPCCSMLKLHSRNQHIYSLKQKHFRSLYLFPINVKYAVSGGVASLSDSWETAVLPTSPVPELHLWDTFFEISDKCVLYQTKRSCEMCDTQFSIRVPPGRFLPVFNTVAGRCPTFCKSHNLNAMG